MEEIFRYTGAERCPITAVMGRAACAGISGAIARSGRMGRNEARPFLAGYLREEPSAELIDAVAPVAYEECIILLGRIALTMPDLSRAALDALDSIDHPRASRIAAEIGAFSNNG